MINVQKVAHVVLKVRDLERSVAFYRDVLGFKEVARFRHGLNMVFFSLGESHHDLALRAVGDAAPSPERDAPGSTTSRSRSATISIRFAPRRPTWRRSACRSRPSGITG